MQLNIIYNETFVLNNIKNEDKILNIKKIIQEKYNIPIIEQSLQYSGKLLEDDKTINNYHIQNNSFIFLNTELKGGNVPGFPNVGNLILLLGTSSIILLLFYLFFNNILKNLTYIPKECKALANVEKNMNAMNVNNSAFTGLMSKKIGQKGGEKLYGNIQESYLYTISSIFYSALVIVIMTIYLYTMFCNQGLSNWLIIGALGSILIFLIGAIVLYRLIHHNMITKADAIYIITIASSVMSIGLLLASFIIPFVKKTEYLHWSTYLYPVGTVIAFMLLNYINGRWWSTFIKIIASLSTVSLFVFIPYIMAYINNVYKMCT